MNVSDVISLLALLIAAIELGLFIGRMKWPPPRKRRRPLLTMKTCIGVGKTRCHGCHPCPYLICKRPVAQALRQAIERRRQDEFVSARARRLLNYVVDAL